MADIFLSYSSDDRERMIPLVEALQSDGYSVWWDREIRPGPSFDREIEAAVNAAKCIVVLWSASSVDSEWVRSEVEEGARRGQKRALVIKDPVDTTTSLRVITNWFDEVESIVSAQEQR